jgi:hypothetical protein
MISHFLQHSIYVAQQDPIDSTVMLHKLHLASYLQISTRVKQRVSDHHSTFFF